MLRGPLDQIDASIFENLCRDSISESQTLELKESLPDRNDRGKSELAKDVVALANAEGGDIVFGIREAGGAAAEIAPIAEESADDACRRLGQVLDSGVEPRLHGLKFRAVDVSNGYVLVIRVPSSTSAPHRVIVNNASRFVIRENNYCRDMTYLELGKAFGTYDRFRATADKFRESAVRRVMARTTWRPLPAGPASVVQVVPFGSPSESAKFDIAIAYDNFSMFMGDDWSGASRIYNLDGVAVYHGGRDDVAYGYNQIYRDGRMEGFSFAGRSFDEKKIIPSLGVARHIKSTMNQFLSGLKAQGVEGRCAVLVSLIGVDGYELGLDSNFYFRQSPRSDRDILLFPDVILESLNDISEIDKAQRSILDVMWQSFGISSCTYYDEHGSWRER